MSRDAVDSTQSIGLWSRWSAEEHLYTASNPSELTMNASTVQMNRQQKAPDVAVSQVEFMYLVFTRFIWGCTFGGVYVPCIYSIYF